MTFTYGYELGKIKLCPVDNKMTIEKKRTFATKSSFSFVHFLINRNYSRSSRHSASLMHIIICMSLARSFIFIFILETFSLNPPSSSSPPQTCRHFDHAYNI